MSYDQTLGKRIATARRKCGRSEEEVAGMIGVPVNFYQAWEAGIRTLRVNELILLAVALDTTPNELLDWEE